MLVISKLALLALVKNVPSSTIGKWNEMKKQFIWKNKNPKSKHTTLCNNYEKEGLKNVDIFSKITSLIFCELWDYMMTVFMPGKWYIYFLSKHTWGKVSFHSKAKNG